MVHNGGFAGALAGSRVYYSGSGRFYVDVRCGGAGHGRRSKANQALNTQQSTLHYTHTHTHTHRNRLTLDTAQSRDPAIGTRCGALRVLLSREIIARERAPGLIIFPSSFHRIDQKQTTIQLKERASEYIMYGIQLCSSETGSSGIKKPKKKKNKNIKQSTMKPALLYIIFFQWI